MNKLSIIVSTINNNISRIHQSIFTQENVTIINQIPKKFNNNKQSKIHEKVKWIDFDQKGLSKSRNLALELCDTNYVYLCDDDVELVNNFHLIISNSINKYPDVDVFAFNVKGKNNFFKKKYTKEFNINLLNSMKLSSVQLVYKMDFIKRFQIRFDEDFGAGSIYKMGEENIFLTDCIKKGASIRYIPETIALVTLGNSSWFTGFNEKYFFDRGAINFRIMGRISILYSIIFCIRKYNIYKKEITFSRAITSILKGIREYENKSNYY